MNPAHGLDVFNFTLAGAREGFGPFLAVFLQHQGFDPATTGFAMGLAGAAGLAATLPLGALIDRITAKRIAVGAAMIVLTKQLWLVALGQVVIGVADSSLAPLVAALTLGLVGRKRYADRVSRNEAFNHAGNAANAALAALLGYALGLSYVAIAIGVMALATSAVMLTLDPGRIDHDAARGGKAGSEPTWRVLWNTKPLLVLAATVFTLQTASGAMLPFLAQALTRQGHDPSLITGFMAVTAQVFMIVGALLVPFLSRRIGARTVLSVALVLVVVRGCLAAWSGSGWCLAAIQVLEGISMGLAGVAIPALVAEIMAETGHAGAGLGSVMTAFGAGAAVSPLLAGLVAQYFGFPAAFLTLGGIAAVGFTMWIVGGRMRSTTEEQARANP